MAKKGKIPRGDTANFVPDYESEGSDHSPPVRKWISLNSVSGDGFAVAVVKITLSKLSSSERKSLVLRLTSELDQIRQLLNKVELQKRKTTKGRGLNRGIKGKFQTANHNTRVSNANVRLLKQCQILLKKLMSEKFAWVFNTPVDPVKLNIPDYLDVIKNPMDLGTINSKLSSGEYTSPLEFLADVRLTFTNAKTYNKPGSDVHVLADNMSRMFESRWKAIEKKLTTVTASQTIPEESTFLEKTEIANHPLPPFKTMNPVEEPFKAKMTDEDKHKLSRDLEDLLGEIPDNIIDLLRTQSSMIAEDEIEIDIDDLSDDTLSTLRRLLDDHLREKQRKLDKSEACGIELQKLSGQSDSSVQVDKELGNNNDMDEDVDIGGSESPLTSYPPVLIDKDTVARAEECNEAEKDRLQAEAIAAEDAIKRAEEEEEAERMRELETEALLKMEKTVEMNENSGYVEDMEIPPEQLPSSVIDETTNPEDMSHNGSDNFKFGGSNALEQLGLFMKEGDNYDYEEEANPLTIPKDKDDDVEID